MKILGFDGLRGICVILVCITHLGWLDLPQSQFFRNRVAPIVSGDAAVTVFFALSGFLITWLLLKERQHAQDINLKNFYLRRFLRLLPVFLIFLVVVARLMQVEMIARTSIGWTMAALYLYNFVPVSKRTTDLSHTWSLSVEEQFYILWPPMVKKLKQRTLIAICVSVALACIAIRVSLPVWNDLLPGYNLQRWFLPAALPICLGSLTALLNPGDRAFLKCGPIPCVICLLVGSPFYLPDQILFLFPVFHAVASAILVGWIFVNNNHPMVLLLEWKPLRFLGMISYGVYVWQGVFLGTAPRADYWYQKFPQNICLTLITAIVSFFTMEKWARNLKARLKA